MTMRFVLPFAYALGAFNSEGNILPGTKFRFYDAGGLTPRAVYSDKELTTPITQPVVVDSVGRLQDIYVSSGLYKAVWETSGGTEIDSWDHIDPGLGTGGSGGVLQVADGGTGATTAGGARASLGAAAQTALDDETSERQALDARVVTLETGSAFINPGGRLSLSSGVTVHVVDVTAQGTVFYGPHIHNRIMLYDGSGWALHEFAELSQTLADTTKSPAAAANNSAYDFFVWLDGATIRCTRGPAWDSVTSRGTGAGKSELEQVDGVWVNKQNITNGPAAQRGVFVGSIVTNGSAVCAMMPATAAAVGGGACRLDVSNFYNRVPYGAVSKDSTDSWAYSTATARSANNNVANRITFMRCMNDEMVKAEYTVTVNSGGSSDGAIAGVGLDITNGFSGVPGFFISGGGSGNQAQVIGKYHGFPGLGQHFFQAIERSFDGTGTQTWYGDNADAANFQMALTLDARM
jgi:hypothetical protein